MAGEKTEQATPRRKDDERKKGNAFQSNEVVTVVSLIALFYAFQALAPTYLSAIRKCMEKYVRLVGTMDTLTSSDLPSIFVDGCMTFALTAMPLLLIGSAVAILITMAQTRMLVSFKNIAFKANRLNPLSGIKKMFSIRGVVELMKSILKIIVLATIIGNVLKDQLVRLPRLMDMDVGAAMVFACQIIFSIVKTTAIYFAFIAAFDYFYQWWDFEKNLRMSKQEIKEEYKQTEGDPQIKGKIKERQQAQARKRMMQQVPNADVIIRNPTHYAVAIRYDPEKSSAPVVIAKGADRIALRIVAVAEENGILTTENKPLARGLYEAVDLDMEIPEEFYRPVAEVLALVYSLKKKELK